MNKSQKICIVVKCFLEHPEFSIQQLSELPELKDISKSSIQRYLNDSLIESMFDMETYQRIQDLLKLNFISSRKKGGINSFLNNKSLKDENGKFIGSIQKKDDDKLKKKCKHILSFAGIFITNPQMSLQEIADFYNQTNPDKEIVTRDYVYDCLTSKEKYDVLSEDIWNQIELQFKNRQLIGNANGAAVINQKR